jgi:hypothetical protein
MTEYQVPEKVHKALEEQGMDWYCYEPVMKELDIYSAPVDLLLKQGELI